MNIIKLSPKDKYLTERALRLNKHLSYLFGKTVFLDNKKLTICGLKEGRILVTNNKATFKVPIPVAVNECI